MELRADRVREGDVRHDAVAEERVPARDRPVDVLQRKHQVPGGDFLDHRAHRRHADHPRHSELPERVDVGPIGDLARKQAMAGAMPREERDFLVAQPPGDDGVARSAKRRLDLFPVQCGQAGQVIESRAADDSQHGARFRMPRARGQFRAPRTSR